MAPLVPTLCLQVCHCPINNTLNAAFFIFGPGPVCVIALSDNWVVLHGLEL